MEMGPRSKVFNMNVDREMECLRNILDGSSAHRLGRPLSAGTVDIFKELDLSVTMHYCPLASATMRHDHIWIKSLI